MTKRMLIDATHAEETRVVVLDGTRLEDFDVETSTKRQLKGNIYLAKVVRVEPSLQAAFVEYGGNRHGFLAFSEIHPDYYQIPVADRQRLIEMQAEDARREDEEDDLELALSHATGEPDPAPAPWSPEPEPPPEAWALASTPALTAPDPETPDPEKWASSDEPMPVNQPRAQPDAIDAGRIANDDTEHDDADSYESSGEQIEAQPPPETVGGGDQESGDDQRERRMPPRFLRNYKIQEVIRRRQILLIQVVKEERGTKGAALTTYLSLAGRFGVLMPNSPRGGGISRKITSAADRRRLKEVMAELDIPRGMGMIVRTAGANRPKPEIKRDCEYLLRLWDDIRENTMKSVAPALIYEEASLIKRAIRDVYSRDIDEILVDGEDGWRAAHDFMRMLMPSHAKKVQLWRDGGQPLFARNQVEAQLDGMLMPTVQLRSGGYLVINQAEALVAIDVNSGRSTRERNIEETALRTNLEAADEVARQLRLRDLAGLIVIDFIDMESKRHNAMVERRIKEALKNDRARIQIGHISHFGLLEMSRQRLRPSLAETSFILCPHCAGTGHVRSTENAAIHVLRGIEDEGSKRRSAEIIVHVSTPVALYLLNHKRERLQEIETRYTMRVIIAADDAQIAPQFRIEKVRTRSADEVPAVVSLERPMPPPVVGPDDEEPEEPEAVVSDDDEDNEDDTAEHGAADTARRAGAARRGGADATGRGGANAAGRAGANAAGRGGANAAGRGGANAAGDAGADATSDTGAYATSDTGADATSDTAAYATGDTGADAAGDTGADAAGEGGADEAERRRKRRRRRRRGGRRDDQPIGANGSVEDPSTEPGEPAEAEAEPVVAATGDTEAAQAPSEEPPDTGEAATGSEDDPRNRRRGRRGGRRRRRDSDGDLSPFAVPGADQPELLPVYAGPTPADPFGGRAFDIFDVMDQAERAAEAMPARRAPVAAEIVNNTAPEPEPSGAQPERQAPAPEAVAPVIEAVAPVVDPAPMQAPESGHPEPADTEIHNTGALEPAGESLTSETADAGVSVPTPANDTSAVLAVAEPPPPEPLIKPILVGAGAEPPAEPKRGWWRR